MPKLIFVNLPVADLPAAKAFYEAIGATNNPQFTDETAACMVFSDTIHVMLLTHDKFAQFTSKRIADAHATSEVLICISADSREASTRSPARRSPPAAASRADAQDHGFMYGRSFEDLDGHIWEPMWMDMEAATAAMAEGQPEPARPERRDRRRER